MQHFKDQCQLKSTILMRLIIVRFNKITTVWQYINYARKSILIIRGSK